MTPRNTWVSHPHFYCVQENRINNTEETTVFCHCQAYKWDIEQDVCDQDKTLILTLWGDDSNALESFKPV